MEIVEKLPDDIVLHIYTKILKRYRFCKGELIKLIDLNKYSFLEKYICRRVVRYHKIASIDASEKKYHINYSIPNITEISNRKDLYIHDDMITIVFTENENSLCYEVSRFRFKRVQNVNNENLPTIYNNGWLTDYDWEVINYSYKI
jgi:hypothetical protein